MIYFISDMHLSHKNILKYCHRPFETIEEMNETLISNWNNVVKPDDLIYNLGDLTLGNPNIVNNVMSQLNGNVHLICGNHDYWMKSKSARDHFIAIDREKIITVRLGKEKKRILLTHFPREIEGTSFDYIIYGHIHNNEHDPFWEYQKTRPNVLNACVDVNDFKPVTFQQLIENNKKIKI